MPKYLSAANAIAASLKVQELSAGKPKLYWAHSFTLVLITGTEHGWFRWFAALLSSILSLFDLLSVFNLFPIFLGFGGGFVAPMMLGKPPAPIANDAVIPFVLVAW